MATQRLPALGLGMASHGQALTAREVERLRALNPAHLRVDLNLSSSHHVALFKQACAQAASLGVALEVALFVGEDALGELDALLALLQETQPRIARWIVFDSRGSSSPDLVELARPILYSYDAHAPVGGGTNGYFTDLNRERPDTSAMDFVAYSLNPQVHAFDNDSLMETPAAQAVTVEQRDHSGEGQAGRRQSGHATAALQPARIGCRKIPHSSSFRRRWMCDRCRCSAQRGPLPVSSIWPRAERRPSPTSRRPAGAASWRPRRAVRVPELFPSTPGGVFPLYHVLADAADVRRRAGPARGIHATARAGGAGHAEWRRHARAGGESASACAGVRLARAAGAGGRHVAGRGELRRGCGRSGALSRPGWAGRRHDRWGPGVEIAAVCGAARRIFARHNEASSWTSPDSGKFGAHGDPYGPSLHFRAGQDHPLRRARRQPAAARPGHRRRPAHLLPRAATR